MGNKEKLQTNNTNLRERVLQAIQNLPGGVSYTGDNPLTVGSEGVTIPANTLIEEALELISGGVTGIDYGTVTPSKAVSALTIAHTLGVKPTRVFIWSGYAGSYVSWVTVGSDDWGDFDGEFKKYSTIDSIGVSALTGTSTQFTVNLASKYVSFSGSNTYKWIAIA